MPNEKRTFIALDIVVAGEDTLKNNPAFQLGFTQAMNKYEQMKAIMEKPYPYWTPDDCAVAKLCTGMWGTVLDLVNANKMTKTEMEIFLHGREMQKRSIMDRLNMVCLS